jgi:hypothetical protein
MVTVAFLMMLSDLEYGLLPSQPLYAWKIATNKLIKTSQRNREWVANSIEYI